MYEKDTICVHSTRCPKPACGSITTPIFQAATFVHEGVGVEPEYSYSRLQNPTRAALEARVAELENGVDAIAFSSGMAAETALMNIFESSGHIIAGDDLYGGSLRLFRYISALSGLRFDFTDQRIRKTSERNCSRTRKRCTWKHPATPPCRFRILRPLRKLRTRRERC